MTGTTMGRSFGAVLRAMGYQFGRFFRPRKMAETLLQVQWCGRDHGNATPLVPDEILMPALRQRLGRELLAARRRLKVILDVDYISRPALADSSDVYVGWFFAPVNGILSLVSQNVARTYYPNPMDAVYVPLGNDVYICYERKTHNLGDHDIVMVHVVKLLD